MGWKGNVRSINSVLNEAQRASARRQRELARQQAQAARMAEIDRAAYEVAVFENTMEVITSLHRETPSLTDWEAIRDAPEPQPPTDEWPESEAAQNALGGYTPKGLAKIGGIGERKRASLERAVEEARALDAAANEQRRDEYQQAHSEWEHGRAIAARVLEGDLTGYLEAFKRMTSFADMSTLGARLRFVPHSPVVVETTIEVQSEDVVPREVKTQLKTGRLSTKQMPKGRFYETYQDYVCGAMLRVANELCALFPVKAVIVTAEDDMLDTSTGHIRKQALASAIVPRSTLESLNLELADASDVFKNLLHRMKFKKTTGFEAVEAFEARDVPEELAAAG